MFYTRSNGVSILITDRAFPERRELYYGGDIEKLVARAASVFTAEFNEELGALKPDDDIPLMYFTGRSVILPEAKDVQDYFALGQFQQRKYIVSSIARQHFTKEELSGKQYPDIIQMLKNNAHTSNWQKTLPPEVALGTMWWKESVEDPSSNFPAGKHIFTRKDATRPWGWTSRAIRLLSSNGKWKGPPVPTGK